MEVGWVTRGRLEGFWEDRRMRVTVFCAQAEQCILAQSKGNLMVSDITLRLAQKRVDEYTQHDKAMEQHYAVMKKCLACEKFLSLGVEAYRWLKQADDTVREAARQGITVDGEIPSTLEYLYRRWSVPCEHAERLIKAQEELGYAPENLDEFRQACREVERQVRLFDMDKSLDAASEGVVFDADFWKEVGEHRAS